MGRSFAARSPCWGIAFVVGLPKGGQIRVPVQDVELEAKDLGEIYEFKRAKLVQPRADDHLRLANWCLNHHLVLRAMEEVDWARRKGGSVHLPTMERRLRLAMQAPSAKAVAADAKARHQKRKAGWRKTRHPRQ